MLLVITHRFRQTLTPGDFKSIIWKIKEQIYRCHFRETTESAATTTQCITNAAHLRPATTDDHLKEKTT